MATCRQVITRALEKIRVRAVGDAPSAEEAAGALQTLQSLYDELIAIGAFGRLTEVLVDDAYTAGENERIYNTSGSPVTITLPETIQDDDTGLDRPPRDRCVVVIASDPIKAHLYSAPLGEWQELTSLALEDVAPLSERSFDGLSSLLAVALSEENLKPVGPVLQARAQAFRSMIVTRFDSPRTSPDVEYF